MELIDKLLNKMTMYRLVVYALGFYSALSIVFAFMGRISATPTELVASLAVILVSAYVTDRGFARYFKVPTNMESALITSLILFLIMKPADTVAAGLILALGGAISSASKFLVGWNGKHIFNPAAIAAAILSLTGLAATTWWIGNSSFWPFTLILGLAIVHKIHRFPLFLSFAAMALLALVISFAKDGILSAHVIQNAMLASPFIFLGTVMLTEPATMPPRRREQLLFGALVGGLYVGGWGLGPFVLYPEVALLAGNVFAYIVAPKFRVRLRLKEIQRISDSVYNYVFQPDRRFNFIPGQYMEWTIPNPGYDSRGNRRTFTIASSPTETDVQLGIKYYLPASTYKSAFTQLKPGDSVFASQLAGNFTLDGVEDKKLAFIAGGIGITPFRSMIKYLTDTQMKSDIALVYVVSDPDDFAYLTELREAAQVGIRTIPVVTDLTYQGANVATTKINADSLAKLIPDFAERAFYISGPNSMVDGSKYYLKQLGVSKRHIKTDHFSGY